MSQFAPPIVGYHLCPTLGTNLQWSWIFLPLAATGPATKTVHPLDPGVRAHGGRQLCTEEEFLGKALRMVIVHQNRHQNRHNSHHRGHERSQFLFCVPPLQCRSWWQRVLCRIILGIQYYHLFVRHLQL